MTYSTASGQEQQQGAHLPWTKSFKVRRGEFAVVDISAQNQGSGTVTCEIDVDGQKMKAAKSSGQYALVSCDHTLGF
ncbi:MmpS family protein [Actinoallomurus purpureus]|nr:MmpS family protein [Actinoallomurus purpureus]